MIGLKHAPLILGALAALVFFGLWRLEVAETKNLQAEIDTLQDTVIDFGNAISQCEDDKQITEKVSNDYQKSIVNLRRQLNSVRTDPRCIPTEPSGSSGISSGSGGEFSGRNGLRSEWLRDFAGRAEETRITANSCIEFMDQVYKSRGYND